MRHLLRDKQLAQKLAISRAELHRRRKSDPDFPISHKVGPMTRVTEDADADAYIDILKTRAAQGLPVPGRRPRGRPRKVFSNSPA
jgi:predicted DNA-binding transcriptional regulator AlpA